MDDFILLDRVTLEASIVANSEIIYECNMAQKNTGAAQKARVKVTMDNVYTDEYPDGIITYLYFTNGRSTKRKYQSCQRVTPNAAEHRGI
jgi:hypothetical protein